MSEKQKQLAVLALLVWYFWPRPQANDTSVSIRTDPDFYPESEWRDYVFY